MNEREALEKISNISEINDCTCFYEDFKNCDTCDANKGCAYYIATQALAPQEPQEKTFTVEEIDQLTQKLEKAKSTLSELVNMFFSDLEDFEIVERLNEHYLEQLKEAQQALKELE